jgi:hypothetical protein
MEEPLVEKTCMLEKFPGKGGWTYARVPEVLQDKHAPFGWVRVKGYIDNYPFTHYHLMPMGNGELFFPVKAAIRKKIQKEAGDMVHIIIYPDNSRLQIPQELEACLQEEPEALARFQALKAGEQKEFIDWIYEAKKEDTKVQRIVATIDKLLKGLTLRETRA